MLPIFRVVLPFHYTCLEMPTGMATGVSVAQVILDPVRLTLKINFTRRAFLIMINMQKVLIHLNTVVITALPITPFGH